MKNFEIMESGEFEQFSQFYDAVTGLRGITCIHNTHLGPALGGTRIWFYDTEEEAVNDAARLAKGMTYKAACAQLNLGGGKTVLWMTKEKYYEMRNNQVLEEAFFRAYGRYIESLNGRYITAEDVNTKLSDMDYIKLETDHVTGLATISGDPSPLTALGVYYGIKACFKHAYGSDDIAGKTFAFQGAGNVAKSLAEMIHKEGGKIIFTDLKDFAKDRIAYFEQNFAAKYVELDEIYDVEADCFVPCALGGIVNSETLPRLKVKIIAGSANNVLGDIEKDGLALHKKGLIYAPDYVINAGGLINVYQEMCGYNYDKVIEDIKKIYDRILQILDKSAKDNQPSSVVSDEMAEARIAMISDVRRKYVGN